ncbi:MAG: transcriptional regulator, AraC family protein [Paenibacillus sp.]|nr:transcriptional regulator, AraC family protein [Paenibacillus sp.]
MRAVRSFVNRFTFKRKLLAYSILLSIVPVLLIGAASYTISGKILQKEVDEKNQFILSQTERQFVSFLKDLDFASIQLAGDLAIEKAMENGPFLTNLDAVLDMKESIKKYRNFSEFDFDVSLVFSKFDRVYSNRYGSIPLSEFPYRDILQTDQPIYHGSRFIPPHTAYNQNELLLIRPVPIMKSPDEGYLFLHVNMASIGQFLKQIDLGLERKLIVVDEMGRIVISNEMNEMGAQLTTASELYHVWLSPNETENRYSIGGTEYKLSLQKSTFNKWTYIVLTPMSELNRQTDYIRTITLGSVAVLVVVWTLIAYIGSRTIYVPIERLRSSFIREKPSSMDDITEIHSYMNSMMQTNEQLQNRFAEFLPHIKESLFQKLLRGEMAAADEIRSKTESIGMRLKGDAFCVCVMEVDKSALFQKRYSEKDRALLLYAYRKMIEESCDPLPVVAVSTIPGQVALLFGLDEGDDSAERHFRHLIAECHRYSNDYLHLSSTVAFSKVRKGYSSIADSYDEALSLLNRRLLAGNNSIFYPEDSDIAQPSSGGMLVKLQKSVIAAIAQADLEGAKLHFGSWVAEIPKHVHNPERVRGLFDYLIGEIDYLYDTMGYDVNAFFQTDLYRQLHDLATLQEMSEWFQTTLLPAIGEHLSSIHTSNHKKLIPHVLLQIEKRYDTDLSLQQMADECELTPTQLSRAFKEEMNMSYTDYIIQFRMAKAKEWLRHSDLSIKEITERLTYTSVQNFTRVFKQMTGEPPGNYRKKYRGQEQG